MAKTVLWLSFGFVVYVYIGYPALLWVIRSFRRRPVRRAAAEPTVSLLIAAHDEKDNIEKKILNCLELDYPKDRMQIVLALDAPTDGTEDVVWKYAGKVVDVVYYSPHRGKAAALNSAVAAAEGEILVFADARQRLDRTVIRELVANFEDPEVGAVSGELMLLDANGREAGDSVGLYWRYEKALRAMESDIHSVLGATGALYAIRRRLFRRLPPETILDDVAIPMRAVLAGMRVVFEPRARVFDEVTATPELEYRRKVRTLMGNFQLLTQMPELLHARRNPVFWQLVSHKVARLFVPYALLAFFISNIALVREPFYFAIFILQVIF